MNNNCIWGILGGMGPIASAEFLKTIYEGRCYKQEQDLPIILLLSDPTMPDRTKSLLQGNAVDEILGRLDIGLRKLVEMGATHTAVCCITIHTLFPYLPIEVRQPLTSLVDIIFKAIVERSGHYLMLCSNGSREAGLFEWNALYKSVTDRLVFPGPQDQQVIHNIIYEIKNGFLDDRAIHKDQLVIDRLVQKYETTSFIVGCTELHVIAKRRQQMTACIDPLQILADSMFIST